MSNFDEFELKPDENSLRTREGLQALRFNYASISSKFDCRRHAIMCCLSYYSSYSTMEFKCVPFTCLTAPKDLPHKNGLHKMNTVLLHLRPGSTERLCTFLA